MGYIKVKTWVLGIYGNVNCHCPQATPSNWGRFTAINPGRPGFNYYVNTSHVIIIESVDSISRMTRTLCNTQYITKMKISQESYIFSGILTYSVCVVRGNLLEKR